MARKDPYQNFRYLVEIDGIAQAGFSEATIPDSAQDPIEYREGNEPPTVRKLPGLPGPLQLAKTGRAGKDGGRPTKHGHYPAG
jgi:hypothetical protein